MCHEQSNAHAAIPVTGSDRITDLPSSDFLRHYVSMYPLSLCQQSCQLTRLQLCRLIIEEFPSYPVPTQALAQRALRRRVPATWTVLSSQSIPVMDTRPVSIVPADRAVKAVCSPENPAHQDQMVHPMPNADSSGQWPVGIHAMLLVGTPAPSPPADNVRVCQCIWISSPVAGSKRLVNDRQTMMNFARACSRCCQHV